MGKLSFSKKKIFLVILIFLALIIVIVLAVVYLFAKNPAKYYTLKSQVFPPQDEIPEDVEPVSQDFGLVVPKLGINVPVIADVNGLNPNEFLWKVTEGVAHFKHVEAYDVIVDGAFPGQIGNIFLFGHSQIPGGDTSKYQAVFNESPALNYGDKIIVFYNGEKYEYHVVEGKIIGKTDVYYLEKTPEETLHLMTCWPLGFNNERYLITALRTISN